MIVLIHATSSCIPLQTGPGDPPPDVSGRVLLVRAAVLRADGGARPQRHPAARLPEVVLTHRVRGQGRHQRLHM